MRLLAPLAKRPVETRYSISNLAQWISQSQLGFYQQPVNTTYGKDPSEPIGNDFEGMVMGALRADSVTSGSLLLLSVRETERPQVDRSLRDDRSVNLWNQGGDATTFAGALQVLTQRAGSGVSADRAQQLALLAAGALTRIGQSGGGVFRMADGELDLAAAMKSQAGPLRAAVAEVLSWVPTQSAQRTLLNAGLDASDASEQAVLLQAASGSARRFGDKADPGQVDRLRALMTGAPGPAADAAAQCYGALNLGPQEAIKLIVK